MIELLAGGCFTLLLLLGFVSVAVPLANRWTAQEEPLMRGLAAVVVAAALLTGFFHLLLWMSLFNRVAAAALWLASILVARALGFGTGDLVGETGRALRVLMARCAWRPAPLIFVVAGLFVVLTSVRALMLPTVGWDSITYHYVKAGMWVQSGGPIALDAPGGWSLYRSIFGGGEVFTAWAMLPFGNDMLAGGVDVAFWLCNGLALYALARELGVEKWSAAAAALYAMFLPAVWDAVGWGYVDLANTAFLQLGLLFCIRYLQTGRGPLMVFGLLALGLAAGVKLTSVPVLAVAGLVLFAHIARNASAKRVHFVLLMAASLAAVAIVSPWLIRNAVESGYPLRFPLTLFGIPLGADNPAFAWSQDRELAAYTWASEWGALAALFPWPWLNTSHLSALSVLPLVLAPFGFVRLARTRSDLRAALVLIGWLFAAVLFAFYSPAFSFSRLEFTWVNGRFLMPIVFLALPLAFAALPTEGRARSALSWFLLCAMLAHVASFGPMRVLQPYPSVVITGFVVALAAVGFAGLLVALPFSTAVRAGGLALLLLASLAGLDRLRELDRRYLLLVNRNVSDDVFRYWWQAAHLAEREGDALRIAVTAGPRQDADNWLMYYFLGSDLQNTLHYLPISSDGQIIPFGPDARRSDSADVEAWLERIENEGITHVFSFFPTSIELGWMDERPGRFLRLNGNQDHWAFFRVLQRAQSKDGTGPETAGRVDAAVDNLDAAEGVTAP